MVVEYQATTEDTFLESTENRVQDPRVQPGGRIVLTCIVVLLDIALHVFWEPHPNHRRLPRRALFEGQSS